MRGRVRSGIAKAGTPLASLLGAALLTLLAVETSAFLHSPPTARRSLALSATSLHGRALPRAVAARLRLRVMPPPALGRLSCQGGAQEAATAESSLLEDTQDSNVGYDSALSEVVEGSGGGDLAEGSEDEAVEIPLSVALHGTTLSEVGRR